jgi:hypothetical protein
MSSLSAQSTTSAPRSRDQCRETLMSRTFEIVLNTGRRDIVVVAMDAGNEIDDEIAAHLLMKHFDKGHIVFFAQVPGAKIGGGDKEAMERVNRMRKVFPKEFGNQDIWSPTLPDGDFTGDMLCRLGSNCQPSTFVLCLLEDFLSMVNKPNDLYGPDSTARRFKVKWFLQIAPLWGFAADRFLNLVARVRFVNLVIENRVVQGDLENPEKSMNCTKAIPSDESGDKLRAEYYDREKVLKEITKNTVSISTQFARQVATPYSFISSLPDELSSELLGTAFRQFVGRPDPKLPWAESILEVNHRTIMMMLRRDKMYEIMLQPTEERLVYLVDAFLKPENKRREEIGQEPLGEFYSLRLGQIATAVEYITDNRYVLDTSATQFKFEVDSLEDSEYARGKWKEYISENNCDLTPCYDGLTVLYMLERRLRESTDDAGVAGDKSMPSVERCKDILAILQKL